jgi:3-deoxy-D-manno-octulosonic acid kinase
MASTDAIDIHEQDTDDGAILFDKACAPQSGIFAAEAFDPNHWRKLGLAADRRGGRGGVTFIRPAQPAGENWVLRHYRRGGLVARVLGDRYLWRGAQQTRSFAEFRLLAELRRRGVAVPRPIAARFRRSGAHYRADLITLEIPYSQTLAQRVATQTLDTASAQRIGSAIAHLHAAGADHADLNAHNILLDASKVWIIDFDRGQLREPQQAWQQANLARLKRSLLKIGAARNGEAAFEANVWQPLLAAYANKD